MLRCWPPVRIYNPTSLASLVITTGILNSAAVATGPKTPVPNPPVTRSGFVKYLAAIFPLPTFTILTAVSLVLGPNTPGWYLPIAAKFFGDSKLFIGTYPFGLLTFLFISNTFSQPLPFVVKMIFSPKSLLSESSITTDGRTVLPL